MAAYTSYWILKRKPIQIVGNISQVEDIETKGKIKDINEIFVKALALGMIYDFKRQVDIGSEDNTKLMNFFVHLNYHFVYRQSVEFASTAFAVFCPYYYLEKESGD